jgi:hypothetical protein
MEGSGSLPSHLQASGVRDKTAASALALRQASANRLYARCLCTTIGRRMALLSAKLACLALRRA